MGSSPGGEALYSDSEKFPGLRSLIAARFHKEIIRPGGKQY